MTSKLDNAIAEMKASLEKLKPATKKPTVSAAANELTAEQHEALLTLHRLGINLPEGGGFVSAAAVDRAIAPMSVSRRFETKALLARVGILR